MGKRTDIRNAFYAYLAEMTVANGYSLDWSELRDTKSGAFTAKSKQTCCHFHIEPELSGPGQGQSLYRLTSTLQVLAYTNYGAPSVKNNADKRDIAEDKLIEDLRRAFGLAKPPLCAAGVDEMNYIEQRESPDVGSFTAGVEVAIEIKWYDNR